jgi:hypothetical protein
MFFESTKGSQPREKIREDKPDALDVFTFNRARNNNLTTAIKVAK